MIRIVIYEDNDPLRRSMQLLLMTHSSYEVTGSFGHAGRVEEEMDLLQPELVIMDIDMPGRSGMEALQLIKQKHPEILVVMHTVFGEDEKLFASLCMGASGYILKKTSPDKFMQYIQEALEGGAPFSPLIASRVLQTFRQQPVQQPDFPVSPRELQVLALLVKGYSYKLIAAELKISLDTVRKHIGQIYSKLHVSCGTEAVALAIRRGMV